MKQSPEMQKLERMLRSSVLVAGGFMGSETRTVTEVIEADAATLTRLGVTTEQLAGRMQEVTEAAVKGLGNWVALDSVREAKVDEARGVIPCPWSDGYRFRKRVTTVRRTDRDRIVQWSDLSIHFVATHGFFEGQEAYFRIEPVDLVDVLF